MKTVRRITQTQRFLAEEADKKQLRGLLGQFASLTSVHMSNFPS